MLKTVHKKTFDKQYKLMKRRGKDIDKLIEVMDLLVNERPLLPRHENHPLHGKDRGKWECHVEPDWLLIYRIVKESDKVIFYRTGSHSDMF